MLVYRSILDLPTGKPVVVGTTLFRDWLGEKAPGLEVPKSGFASKDGISVTTASAENRPAFYGRMAEETENGDIWTTTVTADAGKAGRWFWLDLERVSNHPEQEGPVPRPPRIISRLLARQECFCGDISVGSKPKFTQTDVDRLLDELFHENRVLPTVVVSNRRGSDPRALDKLASTLGTGLAGIAHVWRIGDEATDALKSKLGDQSVWGGALRVYRPSMRPGATETFRHPVIPFQRLRNPEIGLRAVHRIVLPLTGSRKPPSSYADIRVLPGFPGARQLVPDRDIAELYEELENDKGLVDSQLTEAREELEERDFELEIEREELTGVQRELQNAAAKIDYLETKLAESGKPEFDAQPETLVEIKGCEDAVNWGEENLRHVEFGDEVVAAASALDSHGKAEIWGNNAHRAFAAFERYAKHKQSDPDACGGFEDFSAKLDSSPERIPDGWIAMRESETVDNDPAFRDARTFDVERSKGKTSSVYMPAHIKVQKGKPPAPRIHFFDDTQGDSGKIWVGYFGEHLPSPATN